MGWRIRVEGGFVGDEGWIDGRSGRVVRRCGGDRVFAELRAFWHRHRSAVPDMRKFSGKLMTLKSKLMITSQ